MVSLTPTGAGSGRIIAFDGIRGVAAAIVVVFHYICLFHPGITPEMSVDVSWIVDTPIHLLWNGLFSVAVFFALSGFVMAGAADRRSVSLLSISASRYLRLAVPATVSCLLAWGWLTVFPDSVLETRSLFAQPSPWLGYTYQEPIPTIWHALADGVLANFIRGSSTFNNVLWTMKVELFGSLGIFVLYAVCWGRMRLVCLTGAGLVILFWLPDTYMGFVLGALLYEMHRRNILASAPAYLPVILLAFSLFVGGLGHGAHQRLGFPDLPVAWEVGQRRGILDAVAATALLFATMTMRSLARIFSHAIPVFLGRISFGLYLVHVPPLYTIVLWSYGEGVPEPLIAPLYAVSMVLLAWVFTMLVDEPSLRRISALRARMSSPGPGG